MYLITINYDGWLLSLAGGILVGVPQRTLDLISSGLFLDLSQLDNKLFLMFRSLKSRYPSHLISSLSLDRVKFLIYLGKQRLLCSISVVERAVLRVLSSQILVVS